jgi:hypothetical protein
LTEQGRSGNPDEQANYLPKRSSLQKQAKGISLEDLAKAIAITGL